MTELLANVALNRVVRLEGTLESQGDAVPQKIVDGVDFGNQSKFTSQRPPVPGA